MAATDSICSLERQTNMLCPHQQGLPATHLAGVRQARHSSPQLDTTAGPACWQEQRLREFCRVITSVTLGGALQILALDLLILGVGPRPLSVCAATSLRHKYNLPVHRLTQATRRAPYRLPKSFCRLSQATYLTHVRYLSTLFTDPRVVIPYNHRAHSLWSVSHAVRF